MGRRKAANSVWLQRKEMQEAGREVRQAGALWAAEGLSTVTQESGLHPEMQSGNSVSIPGGAVTSPHPEWHPVAVLQEAH